MKKWTKQNRVFMNTKDKQCTDAISWYVEFYINTKDKAGFSGEINGPRYLAHYISERKDLAPLKVMRAELDKFEEALMKAVTDSEEYNAPS
jgi:hypothetical protein